jgi:hypothetical protein
MERLKEVKPLLKNYKSRDHLSFSSVYRSSDCFRIYHYDRFISSWFVRFVPFRQPRTPIESCP